MNQAWYIHCKLHKVSIVDASLSAIIYSYRITSPYKLNASCGLSVAESSTRWSWVSEIAVLTHASRDGTLEHRGTPTILPFKLLTLQLREEVAGKRIAPFGNIIQLFTIL